MLLSKFGVLTIQAGGAIGVYLISKMPKLSLPTLLLACCSFEDDLRVIREIVIENFIRFG